MNLRNVHPKISREFSVRLGRLQPRDKVRAILLLRAEGPGAAKCISDARRPTRAERQARAEATSRSAEAALPEIDQILKKFDGRRLADQPSAFGAVPVETTADGVIALAGSDCVTTILEDQNILPIVAAESNS